MQRVKPLSFCIQIICRILKTTWIQKKPADQDPHCVPGSLSPCEPIAIAGIMRLTELATDCGIIIYSVEQWYTFEFEKYRHGGNLEECLEGDATELIEETH